MDTPRRLTRSRTGKVLFGLCAGLGRYFKIDPLIFRLVAVLGFFTLSSGLALILFYLIASLIVPMEDSPKTA